MSGINELLRNSAKPKFISGPLFPNSEEGSFLGEAGKRQEFILRCVQVIELQECYSEKIYKFIDDGGNVVINFANKEGGYAVGEKYRIRATVKAHKVYEGVRQTIVIRLKTLELFYESKAMEADPNASSAWNDI
jgi:hypothetical protein